MHPRHGAHARRRKRSRVLGGGDGMAVREMLKYPNGRVSVTLVELDPNMTQLFARPRTPALNGGSLR